MMFALSGRFGALASRIGPRLVMGGGPLIAAVGLLLLMRLTADPDYLVDVLPAMIVFGLGLSMTVAPLTTTVLDAVEERHVGVASGVNNAVAQGGPGARDRGPRRGRLGPVHLLARPSHSWRGSSVQAQAALDDAKDQPLSGGDVSRVPAAEATAVKGDITYSSETAFHLGMLLAAGLMALGGAIALLSVRNPPKDAPERARARGPGSAATAGECGRCPEAEPRPVVKLDSAA